MVCACWPEKIDNLCRTWITAGGHLLDCDGETATNSVSVETVAVEQVVSHMQWHRAPFDWFLSCKSLWKSHQEERTLFLSRISNSWLTQLQNDSGRIANQDVVNHLAKYGHCESSSHQVCWATRQDPSNSNSLSMTLLLSGRTKRTLITHCTHQRQSAPWPVTWIESNAQGCIWTRIMTLVKSFAQWISAFKMHWANWKQLNQNSTSKVHQNHQASTMEPRSSVLKMTTVHHQHKSKPNLSKESSESSSS